MTLTALLIYGLAAWRVASILVNEPGPFDLSLRLRALTGIEHDSNKRAVLLPDGLFSGVLSCIWCCSVWVGFGWVVLDMFFPLVALKVAAAFAFSTVAVVIQKEIER